jgi:hypothetical protein
LRSLPCSTCCNHRANLTMRLRLQYKSDSRRKFCTALGPQASKNRRIGTLLKANCFHGVLCSKVYGKSEMYGGDCSYAAFVHINITSEVSTIIKIEEGIDVERW